MSRKPFTVTFDIVTDESAKQGDCEAYGIIDDFTRLRDALKALNETRTSMVDSVECIEPDCIPCDWPRSVRVVNSREFKTGACETRYLHIPARITRASARRIARLAGVADHTMTLD